MSVVRFFDDTNVQAEHQFSNIVETTQLTNHQILEFRCHCEHSTCPPPTSSSNTSLQSLNLRSLSQSCRSVFVAGCFK